MRFSGSGLLLLVTLFAPAGCQRGTTASTDPASADAPSADAAEGDVQ